MRKKNQGNSYFWINEDLLKQTQIREEVGSYGTLQKTRQAVSFVTLHYMLYLLLHHVLYLL